LEISNQSSPEQFNASNEDEDSVMIHVNELEDSYNQEAFDSDDTSLIPLQR